MLTPERIMELEQQSYVKGHRPISTKDCWGDEKITYEPTEYFNMFMFARAVEAEVRKQDYALIRQMHDAMSNLTTLCLSGGSPLFTAEFDRFIEATTAAQARLEENTNK